MLTQRLANIIFVLIVLIACIYFGALAQGFETTGLLASSGLPSKFFPQLILGVTALCAMIVGILYVLRGSAGGDTGQMVFGDAGEARCGLLILAVSVLCYLVWSNVGFLPMAVLMGPLSLLVMGIRSIGIYVTVLVLTALIYVIFTQFLGVQLT